MNENVSAKMLEALKDSKESLRYALTYLGGSCLSAEDDINYSLKLIQEVEDEMKNERNECIQNI